MTDERAGADDRTGKNTAGSDVDPEPNIRPGPTDQGGHGGMATREQEARERRKRSAGGAGDASS